MQDVPLSNYHGKLYAARDKSKAMIIVTGSDGGHKWPNKIAEVFCSQGVSCYSLSYWGEKGLPRTLSLIPIEIIRSAAVWLKGHGYDKIGIYGISKGAELALTAASLLSEIEFVAAISPACFVFEGIAKPKYSGASSWTWQGKPLPYVSFRGIEVNLFKNIVKTREFGFTPQYLIAIGKKLGESSTIKAENINGPLLLLAAKDDAQWPSAQMGNIIVDRLKKNRFSFSAQFEIFDTASHILCPVKTVARFAYRVERSHPTECNAARQRALKLTLEFLDGLILDRYSR